VFAGEARAASIEFANPVQQLSHENLPFKKEKGWRARPTGTRFHIRQQNLQPVPRTARSALFAGTLRRRERNITLSWPGSDWKYSSPAREIAVIQLKRYSQSARLFGQERDQD
jgi:hypothetical protein